MQKSKDKRAATLHPWELALLLALCLTLGTGALSAMLMAVTDQAEKLQLRDRILHKLAPLLETCGDRDEALEAILSQQEEIEAMGDVTMQLDREYFPTRRYGRFSLPAEAK